MSAEPMGHLTDATGRRVPLELVKPIDRIRDGLVKGLVSRAKEVSRELEKFKRLSFSELESFLELSASEYKTHFGGFKGNVSLVSYCGRYQVRRTYGDRLTFDERLSIAKSLVDECVRDWAGDARPEVKTLVEHAFQVDKQGRINTERVLSLRRLDIDDERWLRAMVAIGDSLTVAARAAYVRFYERETVDHPWRLIALSIADVAATQSSEVPNV